MHSLAMGKGFISHLKIKNLSTLLQPRAANILGAASGMSFPFQLPQAAKPMATELNNKEILEQGVQINTCTGPECFSSQDTATEKRKVPEEKSNATNNRCLGIRPAFQSPMR